jgi:catechol 2,3-dioxygenase-like lactoylglutathione lyase family enzyme
MGGQTERDPSPWEPPRRVLRPSSAPPSDGPDHLGPSSPGQSFAVASGSTLSGQGTSGAVAGEARFLYSGIRVRDLPASLRFYRALGFRVFRRGVMDHGGEWVHLKFPGSHHRLELNYYPPGSEFFEPLRAGTEFDHFGFWVKDLGHWVSKAKRAGGRLKAEVPDGRSRNFYLEDPNGIWLEFFGPAATAPRAKGRPPRRRRSRKP